MSLRSPSSARRTGLLTVIVAALFVLSLAPLLSQSARAAVPNQSAAEGALTWLRAQQQTDGSFSAFGGSGDPGTTADAVMAFASAGVDPHGVQAPGGVDAVSYLEASGPTIADNPGLAAKVALALYAAGADPRAAGGVDLLAAVTDGFDPATGWYGTSFYGNVLALIVLQETLVPIDPGALQAIEAARTPDGSWGFNGDPTAGTGDSNTTAVVVQALVSMDADAEMVTSGLSYLETLQDDNGAIAYDGNFPPLMGDANSTALAIQAFVAAGEDPSGLAGGDLVAALGAFQNPSGAFQFQPAHPDDSLLATVQSVPALLLREYPIPPVAQDSPVRAAAEPAEPIAGCTYFDVTQHNVCDAFAPYWETYGGLEAFGYPLTEAFDDLGLRVQYFERARFEWHPENAGTPWEVLLTRLGADEVDREYRDREAPVAATEGCDFASVTGHNVCGAFSTIWQSRGGLAIFGYPLTEQFTEDGVTVQYFERARFELRPGGWPDHLDVFFGRVGAEAVERELAH